MNSKSNDSDITYKSPSICMTASQDPLPTWYHLLQTHLNRNAFSNKLQVRPSRLDWLMKFMHRHQTRGGDGAGGTGGGDGGDGGGGGTGGTGGGGTGGTGGGGAEDGAGGTGGGTEMAAANVATCDCHFIITCNTYPQGWPGTSLGASLTLWVHQRWPGSPGKRRT